MNIYSLSMQIFNKTQINDITLALKSGKAVVLPIDTVWGIASLTEEQIYSVKHRAHEKKVIKFVSSIDEVGLPSFFAQVIKQYWPGGLYLGEKPFSRITINGSLASSIARAISFSPVDIHGHTITAPFFACSKKWAFCRSINFRFSSESLLWHFTCILTGLFKSQLLPKMA